MRWPRFFQRFLYGCFGDRDEPIVPGPEPAKTDQHAAKLAKPEPADGAVHSDVQRDAVVAESSKTASERQQSEQSQSDATQTTTQPTSVETGSKVDSDPDEIAPTKPKPQPTVRTGDAAADPDAITPVESPTTKYVSVKEALADREKLYDRLRRRPESEASPTQPTAAADEPSATASKAEGKKPAMEAKAGS